MKTGKESDLGKLGEYDYLIITVSHDGLRAEGVIINGELLNQEPIMKIIDGLEFLPKDNYRVVKLNGNLAKPWTPSI